MDPSGHRTDKASVPEGRKSGVRISDPVIRTKIFVSDFSSDLASHFEILAKTDRPGFLYTVIG